MGYSGRVGSYTYIRSGGSRGSSNPCPRGYSVDTMIMELLFDNSTYKNITFLVCNEKEGSSDDLALGLGLGLGLGIPVLILILIVLYRNGCFPCTERGRAIRENRLIQPIQLPQLPTERETIFNMLGSRNHRDFMAGNLTDDLKVSLHCYPKQYLILLENYALEHKKTDIALYIRSQIDKLENIRPVPTAPNVIV